MREFSVPVGGASLRAVASGRGAGVIMLHAGVADRRMWRGTLAHLATDQLAAAYDRRGFGETTSPDEPFRHIDDLDAVLDHLGCARASLIGCSQGGRIAIDYALARPARVAALALGAPAVTGAPEPEHYPPEIGALLAELEEAEDREDLERVNTIEAHLWLDGPLSAEGRVGGEIRALFLDMNGRALRHPPLTQQQACPAAIDRLHEIDVPTYVIWGDLDFPHLQTQCRQIVQTIKGARSFAMEGCAHLPNLEQPGRFNQAVSAFLADVL
jgi:pimeloyl-ACP methyl ester carboxylesterase